MKRTFDSIEERLDYIEFRQELLFENTDLCRLIFEYEISRVEYLKIMDLMDEIREKLSNHQSVSHGVFEQRVYEIVPVHKGDYHMCEYIAKGFMNEGRWEEVFTALYGDMVKFQ